jgi:hypothetical protein
MQCGILLFSGKQFSFAQGQRRWPLHTMRDGRPARARAWPGRPWHAFGCGSAALRCGPGSLMKPGHATLDFRLLQNLLEAFQAARAKEGN